MVSSSEVIMLDYFKSFKTDFMSPLFGCFLQYLMFWEFLSFVF